VIVALPPTDHDVHGISAPGLPHAYDTFDSLTRSKTGTS
jgi:hypothetical protein